MKFPFADEFAMARAPLVVVVEKPAPVLTEDVPAKAVT
jgi:hypothetical protein